MLSTVAMFAPVVATILGGVLGLTLRARAAVPAWLALLALALLLLAGLGPIVMLHVNPNWIDAFRTPQPLYQDRPFIYIYPVFAGAWSVLAYWLGHRTTVGATNMTSRVFAGVVVLVFAAAQGAAVLVAILMFACMLGAGCT